MVVPRRRVGQAVAEGAHGFKIKPSKVCLRLGKASLIRLFLQAAYRAAYVNLHYGVCYATWAHDVWRAVAGWGVSLLSVLGAQSSIAGARHRLRQ